MANDTEQKPIRILTMGEVASDDKRRGRIPFTSTHISRLIKQGKFPKPLKLAGRRIAFIEDEINDYLRTCAAAR
jgi:predicted DNA-binding transcriptional regulator AlpA